jgi:hypothetical protein
MPDWNREQKPYVHVVATEDTSTAITDEKPKRNCNVSFEDAVTGDEVTLATNVPWAFAHNLKAALESTFELALMVQDPDHEPPPLRDR